jgi:hypothetical protein
MGTKLCSECGQPMLPNGKKRAHPDDYRHARGCPRASKQEHDQTERLHAALEEKVEVKVERADRSPMNEVQWLVVLSCGHERWVASQRKPTRARCFVCRKLAAP